MTARFPEELGLPTQPTGSGPSSVYYTTGFSRCEIQDLCVLIEEIQSSIPEADRRDWPPILALGNSVVITLRCWPGRWHATSPRPRSCDRTASTSSMEAYSGPRKTIFRTRRVATGDGPLSGRIGFAHSTYRKWTVERVLYHRVLSL